MWRSLVARLVRDQEAAGSNPVIPTTSNKKAFEKFSKAFLFTQLSIQNYQEKMLQ